MILIGVDTGGTFTDLVLYDSEVQRIHRHKLLSTPAHPDDAVIAGIQELTSRSGCSLDDVAGVTYGTTVATNAVLQRRGPKTALITTAGFRDVLLLQRQLRYHLYDLAIEKPTPLLRRREIWEATERIDANGNELSPLNEDDISSIAKSLKDAAVESVAVSFLHSYVDPAHEEQAASILRRALPSVYVSLSSHVAPLIGEYERTNTVVVDAYVKPVTVEHLHRLRDRLRDLGVDAPLYVMTSDGGVGSVERAVSIPVRLIESGPAAGAQVAARIGAVVGHREVVAFDMGGTTAKVAVVERGRPTLTDELEVDRLGLRPFSGLPIRVPAIDLVEVGAGGGSIAQVARGVIRVGPESAGAVPGPACYGLGGERPTVTDANLVLGYMDPAHFLGGRLKLDLSAARDAIDRFVARPLTLSVEDAATGIYRVISSNMERAMRAATIQRGKDPRGYALVATGGAGPLHAVEIARGLGMSTVLVPAASGVASAIGLISSERGCRFSISSVNALDESMKLVAAKHISKLTRDAQRVFEADVDRGNQLRLSYSVGLRYRGQGYDVVLELDAARIDVDLLREEFRAAYEQAFGQHPPDDPIETTTWHLDAEVDLDTPPVSVTVTQLPETTGDHPDRAIYDPHSNTWLSASVLHLAEMPVGSTIEGPAVLDLDESTAVLFSGDRAVLDSHLNLIIAVQAR